MIEPYKTPLELDQPEIIEIQKLLNQALASAEELKDSEANIAISRMIEDANYLVGEYFLE